MTDDKSEVDSLIPQNFFDSTDPVDSVVSASFDSLRLRSGTAAQEPSVIEREPSVIERSRDEPREPSIRMTPEASEETISVGEQILRDLILKSEGDEVSVCLDEGRCYPMGSGDEAYDRVRNLLDGLKNDLALPLKENYLD